MHIYSLHYHPLDDHCRNARQQNTKIHLDISRKFFFTSGTVPGQSAQKGHGNIILGDF